jgi:hypothetical protein
MAINLGTGKPLTAYAVDPTPRHTVAAVEAGDDRAVLVEAPPKAKTRWFLDTEFNEDGRTIELISIALVSEDGREYYAVSAEFDPDACNDWVKANVLPHLPAFRMSRAQIAEQVSALLLWDGSKPEIWAYFADYDWVALCQLFGPMVALPEGFPMFCMDLKQLMASEGISRDDLPAQSGAAHDAREDARWVRDAHRSIAAKTTSLHDVWMAGYRAGQDPNARMVDCPYPGRGKGEEK